MIKLLLLLFSAHFLMGCAEQTVISNYSPYHNLSELKAGEIVHLPTGSIIEKDQLMANLASSRIVYVGETHDNINAHAMQLEILKAMHEKNPGRIAVGMEMLKRSSQEAADRFIAGEISEKEWFATWVKDWSNDYAYYKEILDYLRQHKIPLICLRAPDEWMMLVRKKTANSEFESPALKTLPDMDLKDPYHRAQIEAIFQAHPHGGNFERFYAIQVLWDESMAQSVYDFLSSERGIDSQILVFAGSQHVKFGYGIPRRVFRRIPLSYTIVIPNSLTTSEEHMPRTMEVKRPEIPLSPADYLWTIEYRNLAQEKVRLGVMLGDVGSGSQIVGVVGNSTAAEAGLQKGDVILSFNGEPVKNSTELTYYIQQMKPGERATLKIKRQKELLVEVIF